MFVYRHRIMNRWILLLLKCLCVLAGIFGLQIRDILKLKMPQMRYLRQHWSLRKITKLFENTNIGISLKTTNILHQLTKPKQTSNMQELDKNGIYKLTCNTCQMAYIGQTSRNLGQRYQEHTRYIRHNNPLLAYAQHILNSTHEYGPVNNTIALLKHINKTSLLLPN
jgi:hypothetical protein